MRAANGRLTIKGKTETRQLEYDKLLLGIGRKANIEDLGLEAANIRVNDGGVETDETLRTYYEPFVASEVSGQNLERFIISIEGRHTVEIEALLKEMCVPTLIMWGTGDTIFPLEWAYWLKAAIPGARQVIELPSAKVWFPEEYPEFVSEKLREHWRRGGPNGDS